MALGVHVIDIQEDNPQWIPEWEEGKLIEEYI